MPSHLCSCLLICLCAIASSVTISSRPLIIRDIHVINMEPKIVHVNNLPPLNGDSDRISYFKNGTNAVRNYTNELIGNSNHLLQKRQVNAISPMEIKPSRPGQRSLVLILDITKSMSTDLEKIQHGMKEVLSKLSSPKNNPFYNYILVPFTEVNKTIVSPILVTDDKDELLSTLGNVTVYGGVTCPENILSAIIVGLKNALPNSYVLVFTDASAKDSWLVNEVEELIQRKQATVSIVLTGYCDNNKNQKYKVFERITQTSNGQLYDIRSEEIEQILSDFSLKLYNHHVLLTSCYASEADSSRWDFSVDNTVNKLELTISGEDAKVWIYRPDGKMVNDATETVNLPNVKGYTIESPLNGTWQIDVTAFYAHSVRITGESKLSFSYGFSAQSPSSMLDTHFYPLNGTQNILTIVATEKVNLSEVHLLFADQKSKPVVLPLNEERVSNATEYLYKTGSFEAPEGSFRISVNGYNENGIQINRTISTVLRKSNGPPPQVLLSATNRNINEGESSILKCTVQSVAPFEVKILHGQELLRELQKDSLANVSYTIESAELDNGGQYTCVATNIYGSSNQSVTVEVLAWVPIDIEEVFTVTIPKTEYIGVEKVPHIEIPCSVSVEPTSTLTTNWQVNDTKIDMDDNVYKVAGNNLIISNLAKEHSGNYTRAVTVDSVTKSASTELIVQYAPILQELANEEIYVEDGESQTIECTGDALPPVQSKWKLPNGKELEKSSGPLQIEAFESSDEGTYECVLDNGIQPAAVRQVTLRLQH